MVWMCLRDVCRMIASHKSAFPWISAKKKAELETCGKRFHRFVAAAEWRRHCKQQPSMSTAEDLTSAIAAKGEEIRTLKAAKPATLKDDLAPLVAQLTALKLTFKEVTGDDFDPPKTEAPKKEKKEAQPEVEREGPSKKELNKLARKEGRKAAGDKAPSAKAEGASDKPPKVLQLTGRSIFMHAPVVPAKTIFSF